MNKQVLFIQGAGQGAYKEDAKLADSLRGALGPGYTVHYPAMPDEDDAEYAVWARQIEAEVSRMQAPVVLVGHSVGGSVLAKWYGETGAKQRIAGIFLASTPFWGGDGWLYEGYKELELPHDIAEKIPRGTPISLYHSRDDEVVPFEHLALYADALPQATAHERSNGGHQMNDDMSLVAKDIKNL